MNNKNFDERIKAALDNIEPAYDASTWNLLEKRLNAPFAEEHPAAVDRVDKAVFHKLERLEAPYQSAHWEQLASRMQHLSRQRRRIWLVKIGEAAIFLLLLINLDGLLPDENLQSEPAKRTYIGPVASMEQPKTIPTDVYGIREVSAQNSGMDLTILIPVYTSTNPEIAALSFFPPAFVADLLISNEQTATSHFADDAILPSHVSIETTFGLPVGPFAVYYDRINAAPAAVPVNIIRPSGWYVAVGPSFDHNRVYTDHGVRSSNGYGAAVAVGYRKGKWGIETGIGYANKQYEPKRQIEIFSGNVSNGYFGSALQSVEADVVSIPFKATRRIAAIGKGRLTALAGASANVVVQKAYNYDTYYFPGSAPSGSRPPDDENAAGLRVPGRGALESEGQLRSNVYASFDAGIRYEHPIGKRFAAFIEPGFRMALPGQSLGPSKSTVQTLSVQAGIVTSL